MKILWVSHKYLDVSVDRVTWTETIKKLESHDHRVLLLSFFKKKKPSFGLDGRIRYLPSIRVKALCYLTSNLSVFVYLTYYLFYTRPDVVILHPISCLAAFHLAIMKKLKIIKTKFMLDVRTIPVEIFGISGRIHQILFNLSIFLSKYLYDGISVITPFMKRVLSERFDLWNNNIGVWTSGASLDMFDPKQVNREETEILREKLDLRNRFIVMYHGVFTPSRGLGETIQALNLVEEKYADIVLLLVGYGRAEAALQEITNNLNLRNRVIFTGPVPHKEIPSYIALADVGILPFPRVLWWRVSSPIKLMEYLAMGKPVIVTDIEAHRDVINSNRCGIFIPSNNPRHIARGILEAYREKKHLKEIGQNGRKLVQDEYTWEIQVSRLEDYLKSID